MLKIIGFVFLGILLLVFFLLLLPVRVRIRYDGVLRIWIGIGTFSFSVFPLKKRKPKRKKQAAKKASAPSKPRPVKKRSFSEIRAYLTLALQAVGKMKRQLMIRQLMLHLRVGSTDAAKTALLYGELTAGISALYPLLENNLRLNGTDISVDADFSAEKLTGEGDITIAACPLRLLIAGIRIAWAFLSIQQKFNHKKQTERRSSQ